MIKLIIFDLWKTLVYKDVDYSSTSKMLEETGVDIPKKEFVKIFEESVQTKNWESEYDAYENLCQNMGIEVTEENVNLLMSIREAAVAETKAYPHSEPLLKQLKEQGYTLGLISNSSVFTIEEVKNRTNVLDYIDYHVFSYEAGVIKPDLKIFRMMLDKTGYKPEQSVMIGDKMGDDVEPAKSLGMRTILFKDYEQLKKDLKSLGIKTE